jgi:hypothetical protein
MTQQDLRLMACISQHGPDGLSNISETHPQFNLNSSSNQLSWLVPSEQPAHQVLLDILEREPIHTVLVVAAGPCKNPSNSAYYRL